MPEGDGAAAGLDSFARDCTRATTGENGAAARKDNTVVDGDGAARECSSAAREDNAT